MTMIDVRNGDGDWMVFNTKKGGGGEGEEKGGVHPSTLVPGGEGVALQIGMPGSCRPGVEGVEGGGVLPMPPLHLLGLPLPFAPASGQVPRDLSHPASPNPSNRNSSPYLVPHSFLLMCSTTARASVSWSCSTIACRLGLLSNNDNKGSVRLWGWATLGCVTFNRATHRGVQGGSSTILKRSPRHGACAVGAVNTCVHCAESYVVGPLLQKGMSAHISHGARKRGTGRARSNIIWIRMDTHGDIHCNHE